MRWTGQSAHHRYASSPTGITGVIAAFSGQFADTAAQIDNGIKLYMKQHGDKVAGKKIEVIRKKLDAVGHPAILQVDGGVNAQNAHLCVEAGATAMVAGTAVFKGGPSAYAANIKQLKGL